MPGAAVANIKVRFASLNAFIIARGGFVVSGAPEVTIECLPESSLPSELEAAGYRLRPADRPESECILPQAIMQNLTLTSCGVYEPRTPESTKAIAHKVRHAGICKVLRFKFTL